MGGTVAAVLGAVVLSLALGPVPGAILTGAAPDAVNAPVADASTATTVAPAAPIVAGQVVPAMPPSIVIASQVPQIATPETHGDISAPMPVQPQPVSRPVAPVLADGQGAVQVAVQLDAAALENPAAPTPRLPMQTYAQMAVLGPNPDVSIILVMDAQNNLGAEAFSSFPYPVTFAVDAAWDQAPSAMQRLRAAGHEVLALVTPSPDAGATETAEQLTKAVEVLPQTVGVIDRASASLQAGFGRARASVDALAGTGRGIVLHDSGLNSALALAERADLPALLVDAVIDDQTSSPAQIRAQIEAAVALALPDQPVIMLGHLRPDTISALFLWGLSTGPNTKDLLPVSAQLWAAQEAMQAAPTPADGAKE